MDSSPLDKAIAAAGSPGELARNLGISAQAVSAWKLRGIPAERVLAIERVTGVPRTELRPDIYPPERIA